MYVRPVLEAVCVWSVTDIDVLVSIILQPPSVSDIRVARADHEFFVGPV